MSTGKITEKCPMTSEESLVTSSMMISEEGGGKKRLAVT